MSRQLSGFRAWMWQRATALYLAVFIVYVLLKMMLDPPADHQALQAWVASPFIWLATLLFFVALLLHAWVGVRDVILDYVSPPGLRLALLGMVHVFLLGSGLWMLFIMTGVL